MPREQVRFVQTSKAVPRALGPELDPPHSPLQDWQKPHPQLRQFPELDHHVFVGEGELL